MFDISVMVYAMVLITMLRFIVWPHHMYVNKMAYFSAATCSMYGKEAFSLYKLLKNQ